MAAPPSGSLEDGPGAADVGSPRRRITAARYNELLAAHGWLDEPSPDYLRAVKSASERVDTLSFAVREHTAVSKETRFALEEEALRPLTARASITDRPNSTAASLLAASGLGGSCHSARPTTSAAGSTFLTATAGAAAGP